MQNIEDKADPEKLKAFNEKIMQVDVTDNPDLEKQIEEEFDNNEVIIMGEGDGDPICDDDTATRKH